MPSPRSSIRFRRSAPRPPSTRPSSRWANRSSSAPSVEDCHTHPLPTRSFDVGTGDAFQVPKLDGMSMRLPLMHNGCATSIRARFTDACGGDRHGDVAGLSESDLDALVAYLETL